MSLQSILEASVPLFETSEWRAAQRSVHLINRTVRDEPGSFSDINDVGSLQVPTPAEVCSLVGTSPRTPWLDAIEDSLDTLVWHGSRNAVSCAYSQIAGPMCPYQSDELRFGIFFLPANYTYAAHIHGADEIYVPIAGQGEWAFDLQDFEAWPLNTVVPVESMRPHALRTIEQPLLMLYTWTGDISFDRYAFCS